MEARRPEAGGGRAHPGVWGGLARGGGWGSMGSSWTLDQSRRESREGWLTGRMLRLLAQAPHITSVLWSLVIPSDSWLLGATHCSVIGPHPSPGH